METKVLNEHEVAAYLQQNPEFFENHADLLAVMHVPSAHGKGAVSLAERQQVAQRDKIRQLERKYSELLTIGIENDETGNKVHQLTLGLLNSVDFLALNQMLVETLRENFNVPYVNIKLWALPADNDLNKQAAFELVDETLKNEVGEIFLYQTHVEGVLTYYVESQSKWVEDEMERYHMNNC